MNAIPAFDPLLTDGLVFLMLGVGCMTMLLGLLLHVQRPVEDVWQAGREYGRREAIREQNHAARVVSLDERRRRQGLA